MKMKTKNVTYLLIFLFLLIFGLLFIYDFWRLIDINSLKDYYWLPMAILLDYQTGPLWVMAYTLYYDISLFTVFWPVTFIILCLFLVFLPLGSIFRILSKNFESFDEAWNALKAFTRECSQKNKLMLSVPLAYFSIGPSIGLAFSLKFYAQIGLMFTTLALVLFVSLLVVLIIGLFYESAFRNELKSLSPESFKPST